ncbi:hypothetical protein K493DRAFT_313986 [Basidiobolus meristosporus CBS 931.73]|uniref:Uncharacterized protein n=1 Tax=Basidiobolus meristosporus CBS 931.73 TaxID=1314790 RepID=A0A1Y1YHZ0_9FUNG|nr:hypothetical protein K493DRAFT_313986 [Basidiobolus meristosporus CBS 931.73]|eukprot:ORX97650.1 hypothetical protein K493DRAFT_313986 [Basidiobolus meristosporus CBS 931.73]
MVTTVPRQDYRVSGVSVRCVDCGQDVGLYPARHKCGQPTASPTFWTKIMNIYSHTDGQKPAFVSTLFWYLG